MKSLSASLVVSLQGLGPTWTVRACPGLAWHVGYFNETLNYQSSHIQNSPSSEDSAHSDTFSALYVNQSRELIVPCHERSP